MKTIKNILCFTLLAVLFTACDINDREYDDVLEVGRTGGTLTVNNQLISYVVGEDATYTASGSTYQGSVSTQTVDVYKSFTSSATGETSNETLLTSITISDLNAGSTSVFEAQFTYSELIEGLLLNGEPLPAEDTGLTIGDSWTLRYVSNTSAGDANSNIATTKVAVGTRFAGTYRVIASDYYRIGVQSGAADWSGEQRIIESVDATTYKHLGVGPFDVGYFADYADSEYHLFFDLNSDDTVNYEGVGNTTLLENAYVSCAVNGALFENVSCAGSNYVVRDDVEGKDLIYMTYGYFTDGSGTREFYEVLEKIVD
jgi:hypothetical protein